MLIGISSGAALAGAKKLAEKHQLENQIIVFVAADSGEHYLSVKEYL